MKTRSLDEILELIEDELSKASFEIVLLSDEDSSKAYKMGRHDGLKIAESIVRLFTS